MQRAAPGSLRAINPRFAGVGWAAAFSGFLSIIIYNILLTISIIYLVNGGK